MRMGGGKFISLSSTFVELHFLLLNAPLFVGLNLEFRMIFPVQGEHRRYPWSEKRGKWEPFWLEITWELNHWRLSKQNLFRGKNLFHNNKNNNNQLVLFIILSFVLLVAIVPRQDCFSEKVSKGHELSAPAAGKTKNRLTVLNWGSFMTLVSAQGATNKALSKFHILAKNQAAAVFPRQIRGLVTRIMSKRDNYL